MTDRNRSARDRRPDAADAIAAAILERPGMREAVRADTLENRARILQRHPPQQLPLDAPGLTAGKP